MSKSNTEKQTRFRKKEALKRRAGEIFSFLQTSTWDLSIPITAEEMKHNLDRIIELPSNWTNEDYERARVNLEVFFNDVRFSKYLLENDVVDARGGKEDFFAATDPQKYIKEERLAVENTRALAAHIISALELSTCSDSDKAAALMEVVRFVGRALANKKEVPCSKATAVCLSSIGPQYDRPKWFTKRFAETIGWQIGEDLAHDVGKRLVKFKTNIK